MSDSLFITIYILDVSKSIQLSVMILFFPSCVKIKQVCTKWICWSVGCLLLQNLCGWLVGCLLGVFGDPEFLEVVRPKLFVLKLWIMLYQNSCICQLWTINPKLRINKYTAMNSYFIQGSLNNNLYYSNFIHLHLYFFLCCCWLRICTFIVYAVFASNFIPFKSSCVTRHFSKIFLS